MERHEVAMNVSLQSAYLEIRNTEGNTSDHRGRKIIETPNRED